MKNAECREFQHKRGTHASASSASAIPSAGGGASARLALLVSLLAIELVQ